MRYLSTRGDTKPVTLGAALAAGLAADGGLFVPEALPLFRTDAFSGREPLPTLAAALLERFFLGDPLAPELPSIAAEALDIPLPMRAMAPRTWLLELFHGPTAAFKDFGARFLAACLARLHAPGAAPTTVLAATSGDTGAAVAAAFHQRPGFRVVILYPDHRVSPRQAHQLGCFGDNVVTLRVDGSFDDCQALAKRALADETLKRTVPLTSANSISLGRLLPQMAYYAHAALAHWLLHGRRLNFVVPTGNLGNALACVLARATGLPVGDITLATNANRVLPDYFAGGTYEPQPSVATIANAMDVGAPSNFERLRWLYSDDATLRRALAAESVADDEIRDEIRTSRARYGTLICPHTATAARVLARLRQRGDTRDYAVVATAHPAKFETVIEPLIGGPVEVPPALKALLDRPSRSEPIAVDYGALRERLTA
ncbi:MAG TPA: threonine synthase [Rhodanobacteraceae bacterium]|nr:threonine synthase [Rhodanobacteraceae bacterium]